MSKLPYSYWLNHLTELGDWRQQDWDARVIVRGLKQEDFKGYLEAKIGGRSKAFDAKNIEELIHIIVPSIGVKLREDIKGSISIVPIPNSTMAVGYSGPFRSVELAGLVAKGFGNDATVCEAIRWDAPRNKSHQTKEYRHPDLYEPHMVLVDKPTAPIVLFDDVLTSGSQMIAAARMLTKQGFPPARGLVVARATKTKDEGGVWVKRHGELELSANPFELDEF